MQASVSEGRISAVIYHVNARNDVQVCSCICMAGLRNCCLQSAADGLLLAYLAIPYLTHLWQTS